MTQSNDSLVKNSTNSTNSPRIAILVWRGLLLVLGAGIGFTGGLLWAVANPQVRQEKPLVVRIWQGLQGEGENRSGQISNAVATPDIGDRQPLQSVAQLEQELEALNRRVNQLEIQLGKTPSGHPLETRLQWLRQQIESVPVQSYNAYSENDSMSSPSERLKVTLPSEVLFVENDTQLTEGAIAILDEFVVADLQEYSGETVHVAAYTNISADSKYNRELSFYRAQAIEEYLTQALGNQHRWVIAGYAQPHSPGDNSSALNRRIEIAVH